MFLNVWTKVAEVFSLYSVKLLKFNKYYMKKNGWQVFAHCNNALNVDTEKINLKNL